VRRCFVDFSPARAGKSSQELALAVDSNVENVLGVYSESPDRVRNNLPEEIVRLLALSKNRPANGANWETMTRSVPYDERPFSVISRDIGRRKLPVP